MSNVSARVLSADSAADKGKDTFPEVDAGTRRNADTGRDTVSLWRNEQLDACAETLHLSHFFVPNTSGIVREMQFSGAGEEC